MKRNIFNYRKWLLVLIDAACFTAAYAVAALLAGIGASFDVFAGGAVILSCIMLSRIIFRIYSNIWRYAQADVYVKMMVADAVGGIIGLVLCVIIFNLPIYIPCISILGFVSATLLSRFAYRLIMTNKDITPHSKKINVAIIGAGKTGTMLASELLYNDSAAYKPVCFIDNDAHKAGGVISGLKVYNDSTDSVFSVLERLNVQEIFIALPNVDNKRMDEIHTVYSAAGYKIKIYDLPVTNISSEQGENEKRLLREFKIEDLLFRDAMKINNDAIREFYRDRVVMITGGGGSIGSELCRQVAKCSPKQLIILDIYENNAYDIQQELLAKYKDELKLTVEIASVRDRARLDSIFKLYRPEIVFHAAAHKHVPLMEQSSCEAIKNNVLGTYNTADMAEKYGARKFILISTDKAVNPTNVMGASKRLCEMVIQCRTDSETSFAAVRFGNVLGSNGSVIPLFKRQIEQGGPVTLTDKRIIRYFMTIPEASQLVMQAGAMSKRGELFVLNMGKPVKILDLAENMIKLSGYRPYIDIDIVEIGLRPGEKLYEELLMKNETLTATDNDSIFIERDTPLTREEVEQKLAILRAAAEDMQNGDLNAVRCAMKQTVPTYRSPKEVNETAIASEEMKLAGVTK